MLNITKGNVVPMHAILMVDDEIFPVINAENVEVYIQGVFQRYECIHHVEESEDNVVYLEAPDTLPTGVYGVEVKGKMNDVPWRTYTKDVLKITYATEKGDNEPVVPSSDTYDITMEVQLYKTASSDEKIREHNEDQEAHPYIQNLISEVEGKIPVLPEHIVTDEDYVHTENNYTTEEKEKLRGLANYDDAEVRGLIAQKQDVIPDLATIRSGAEKGATAYQKPADGIPVSDCDSYIQEYLYYAIDARATIYEDVLPLIPAQASEDNQLADKNFVNSSVSTATATFKGTYNSVAELEQVTADANDYAFVISTDSAGNTVYNRYKYSNGSWLFEYALNNSSFTAAQWAAINSAITSGDVTKLRALPTKEQLDILFGEINDTLEDHATTINQKANKTNVIQVVFPSSSEEEMIEMLQPNEIAEVSFVDYMNFAFSGVDNTQKCEYCIKFDVGSTVPTLSLPSGIIWAEELTLEADTHYVILISYENGGFYGDWKAYPLT